jgi:hypothetical protein
LYSIGEILGQKKKTFFITDERVHLSLHLSSFICGKKDLPGSCLMGTETAAASLA